MSHHWISWDRNVRMFCLLHLKDALEDHFNDNERSAVGYRVEMEGYKMALDEVMLLIRGLSQGTSPYKSSFSPGLSARGSPIAGVDSQGGLSLSPRRPFGITGVVS